MSGSLHRTIVTHAIPDKDDVDEFIVIHYCASCMKTSDKHTLELDLSGYYFCKDKSCGPSYKWKKNNENDATETGGKSRPISV